MSPFTRLALVQSRCSSPNRDNKIQPNTSSLRTLTPAGFDPLNSNR